MTIEEYNLKKENLEKIFQTDQQKLLITFAKENDTYKNGNVIEDHIGKIKIEDRKVYILSSFDKIPSCMMYYGDNLTKTGSINKKEPKRWVYQINILGKDKT